MTDDSVAAKIAALEAQLAALRVQAAPPAAELSQQAEHNATISNSPQIVSGGAVHDNATGAGALVLHDIRIAAGGTLIVHGRTALPSAEQVRLALASYLRMLLERYALLGL